MSSLDEQELGQRVDRALATITSGPTPAAAILARGRQIRRRRRAARAGAVTAMAALAVAVSAGITLHDRLGAPGPAAHRHPGPSGQLPTKMSGLPVPVAPDLRLLIATTRGASWYSTVTRRAEPIAGLPTVQQDLVWEPYSFGRLDGGWWATSAHYFDSANPASPQVFYFIADGSVTATRIGAGYAGDGADPASRGGAVWLVTHPPSTAKRGGSARAQLVSTAGRPLGPRYTLPAGYLLSRGVGRYLLLARITQQTRFELWDPRTGRVVRRFGNVIAAGPEQIAWNPGCQGCRVQVLNMPTGKTVTAPIPGGQPAALNATISDDGQLLAMQLPGGKLSVLDTISGVLTVIPGTALSDAAWQHFGWLGGGHRLIVTAGLNAQPGPAQVAYWQPGDTQLRIATIHNPGEITTLHRSQRFAQ